METDGLLQCHKSPPLVSILIQVHPFNSFTPYFVRSILKLYSIYT